MLTLISLPSAAGVVIAWIFSVWGSADLLNAFYQANHARILPGQLGATYFIPTFVVPLLLITHGLTFRILLQHQNAPAVQDSGAWHEALRHRKECILAAPAVRQRAEMKGEN